jgi:16S rRNA (guanine966-N2)-methyltransferase
MRISGRQWCGRPILMPKSDCVRPTQDRVREALFNLLMYVIDGARFLDLFAGSGAVGLDALSRGAQQVTFLEKDRTVYATLRKNLETFNVDLFSAKNTDALAWLGLNEAQKKHSKTFVPPQPFTQAFDIVFCDPPYLWAQEHGFKSIAQVLIDRALLVPGGLFVTETDYRTDPENLPGYSLQKDRLYGKTRLVIYQRDHILEP